MKYFVFSIDDGTIYDKKIIDIFNRYDIKATFNLNSGLQDFVWYKSDKPVRRLKLEEKKEIYQGHEIASHSLTHPYLTMCPDDVTYHEVKDDLDNLKQIFDQDIVSFAFPFEDFNEQKINFIAQIPPLIDIRISEIDASFKFPSNRWHIKITSWNIDDALNKVKLFLDDKSAELFVFVAHSYDFEFDNTYHKLEKLCQIIKNSDEVKIITMKELAIILS